MIFMSALMRGMTDEMIDNGLHNLPGEVQIHHLRYRADPSVVNSMACHPGPWPKRCEQAPVQAWSARVRVPAVIASERDSRGVTLLGVDPAAEALLGALPEEIVQGRFLQDEHDRGLVIGASWRSGWRRPGQAGGADVAGPGQRCRRLGVCGWWAFTAPACRAPRTQFVYAGRSLSRTCWVSARRSRR